MSGGPTAEVFLDLFIFWIFAVLSGLIGKPLKIPPLLLYLVFGALLGNLNIVSTHSEALDFFAAFAISFVFLALGLEETVEHFIQGLKEAYLIALFGGVVPFACGYLAGFIMWPDGGWRIHLVIATAVTAKPVSLSLLLLSSIGVLRSRVASTLMSSAVLDDVAALVLVSVLFPIILAGHNPDGASSSASSSSAAFPCSSQNISFGFELAGHHLFSIQDNAASFSQFIDALRTDLLALMNISSSSSSVTNLIPTGLVNSTTAAIGSALNFTFDLNATSSSASWCVHLPTLVSELKNETSRQVLGWLTSSSSKYSELTNLNASSPSFPQFGLNTTNTHAFATAYGNETASTHSSNGAEVSAVSIILVLVKVIASFFILVVLHQVILPHDVKTGWASYVPFFNKHGINDILKAFPEMTPLIVVTFGIGMGVLAENALGLHATIGFYFAGLLLEAKYFVFDCVHDQPPADENEEGEGEGEDGEKKEGEEEEEEGGGEDAEGGKKKKKKKGGEGEPASPFDDCQIEDVAFEDEKKKNKKNNDNKKKTNEKKKGNKENGGDGEEAEEEVKGVTEAVVATESPILNDNNIDGEEDDDEEDENYFSDDDQEDGSPTGSSSDSSPHAGAHSFEETRDSVATAALSWLGPIFFLNLGAGFKITGEILSEGITQALILVSILATGQFLSAALAAKYFSRFSWSESFVIGFGMLGRAELFFVVVDTAYRNKIIDDKAQVALAVAALLMNILLTSSLTLYRIIYDSVYGEDSLAAYVIENGRRVEEEELIALLSAAAQEEEDELRAAAGGGEGEEGEEGKKKKKHRQRIFVGPDGYRYRTSRHSEEEGTARTRRNSDGEYNYDSAHPTATAASGVGAAGAAGGSISSPATPVRMRKSKTFYGGGAKTGRGDESYDEEDEDANIIHLSHLPPSLHRSVIVRRGQGLPGVVLDRGHWGHYGNPDSRETGGVGAYHQTRRAHHHHVYDQHHNDQWNLGTGRSGASAYSRNNSVYNTLRNEEDFGTSSGGNVNEPFGTSKSSSSFGTYGAGGRRISESARRSSFLRRYGGGGKNQNRQQQQQQQEEEEQQQFIGPPRRRAQSMLINPEEEAIQRRIHNSALHRAATTRYGSGEKRPLLPSSPLHRAPPPSSTSSSPLSLVSGAAGSSDNQQQKRAFAAAVAGAGDSAGGVNKDGGGSANVSREGTARSSSSFGGRSDQQKEKNTGASINPSTVVLVRNRSMANVARAREILQTRKKQIRRASQAPTQEEAAEQEMQNQNDRNSHAPDIVIDSLPSFPKTKNKQQGDEHLSPNSATGKGVESEFLKQMEEENNNKKSKKSKKKEEEEEEAEQGVKKEASPLMTGRSDISASSGEAFGVDEDLDHPFDNNDENKHVPTQNFSEKWKEKEEEEEEKEGEKGKGEDKKEKDEKEKK